MISIPKAQERHSIESTTMNTSGMRSGGLACTLPWSLHWWIDSSVGPPTLSTLPWCSHRYTGEKMLSAICYKQAGHLYKETAEAYGISDTCLLAGGRQKNDSLSKNVRARKKVVGRFFVSHLQNIQHLKKNYFNDLLL